MLKNFENTLEINLGLLGKGLQGYNPEITPYNTRVILLMVGLQVGSTIISAIFHLGPLSASATTALVMATFFLLGYPKSKFLKGLFFFSLMAGFVELAGDHLFVYLNKLEYPDRIKIWSSPLYMPFAWAMVLVELCYFSVLSILYFSERYKGIYSLLITMLLIMLVGALYIPFYEQLAYTAEWWEYKNCALLCQTPIFVILAEGILVLLLPFLLLGFVDLNKFFSIENPRKNWRTAALLGILQGIWICFSAIVAYYGLVFLGLDDSFLFCPF